MLTKKKDLMERLETIITIFKPLLHKPITITFDIHTFTDMVITDIILGKTGDLDIKYTKNADEKGKMRSPAIFYILLKDGDEDAKLVFPFDDTVVVTLGNKARIIIGGKNIDFALQKE
jgi:hypothetical protein